MSIQMSLAADDTTLAGSGTYSMTGQTGEIPSITGYVFWQVAGLPPSGRVVPAHPEMVLNLAFDNGLSALFNQGRLVDPDTLRGTLTFADSAYMSYVTSFAREPGQANTR